MRGLRRDGKILDQGCDGGGKGSGVAVPITAGVVNRSGK